jgi:hypothetical protein
MTPKMNFKFLLTLTMTKVLSFLTIAILALSTNHFITGSPLPSSGSNDGGFQGSKVELKHNVSFGPNLSITARPISPNDGWSDLYLKPNSDRPKSLDEPIEEVDEGWATMMYIIIGVVGAVGIVALLVVLVCRAKKRSSSSYLT